MKQWRVSWMMWPHLWESACATTKTHDSEEEARDQLNGLLSMQASHLPRPCDKHVWDIKLEERETGEWEVKP